MNDNKVNRWADWGDGIEVLTRAMPARRSLGAGGCSACQELKRRLKEACIAFRELDLDTVDGRAAAAWYGDPGLVPAVAIEGQLIDAGGDVDALFAELSKQLQEGTIR